MMSFPKDNSKKRKGPAFQPNLFAFFASNVPTPPKKKKQQQQLSEADAAEDTSSTGAAKKPMVPTETPTPRTITWQSLKDNYILVRREAPSFFAKPSASNSTDTGTGTHSQSSNKSKVAALDLDGTLFVWKCTRYPSELAHYELWNSQIPKRLREWYDQGYQLILISNQGIIQKAHTGKKAQLIQNVMNWLESQVQRPIWAVISTVSLTKDPQKSFHKPTPKLWQVVESSFSSSQHQKAWNFNWNWNESFFVGDSEDPNDAQGGVDRQFAQHMKTQHSGFQFFTPQAVFGPSYEEEIKRRQILGWDSRHPIPIRALAARQALMGGYCQEKKTEKPSGNTIATITTTTSPILLILCGPQGSGKSTWAAKCKPVFLHFCQDTIQNGKRGSREAVEKAVREALLKKPLHQSVIVDRMHLTPDQREPFLKIGVELGIPVHILVLYPPASVIAQRVRQRTNHSGNVQGKEGVRLALQAREQLIMPHYQASKVIALISMACTDDMATQYLKWYFQRARPTQEHSSLLTVSDSDSSEKRIQLSESLALPRVTLGTMGMTKNLQDTLTRAISSGFQAVDTAPTYRNLKQIGQALMDANNKDSINIIAKLPKTVTHPDQVRSCLASQLEDLQRSHVDLLLLHWPCEVIQARTLVSVWREMEACCREGKCHGLGVCNFNIAALSDLLPHVTIPPLVLQVERHPLLAQSELLDFCARQGIHVQAHTPLGQGRDELLCHKVVQEIANECQASPASVVLRWNLQQGVSVVPKCQSEEHMKEVSVLASFRLSPDQMKRLDALECGKRFVAPPFMFGEATYCW